MKCPYCGGANGQCYKKNHLRCRDCGRTFTFQAARLGRRAGITSRLPVALTHDMKTRIISLGLVGKVKGVVGRCPIAYIPTSWIGQMGCSS